MSEKRSAMPPNLRRELGAAFDKFAILSPMTFSFGGEPAIDARASHSAPGWMAAATNASAEGAEYDQLAKAIQATLYHRCYARRPGGLTAAAQANAADPQFAQQLAAANAGREYWDRGWSIHQFGPNGQVFVRKGDRERVAMPGAFVTEGAPGTALQIGVSVSIPVLHQSFEMQSGYYFAFGDTPDELADTLSLVRFYFHCGAANAAALVAEVTAALNRFQAPFQFKTPATPALYGRTDAAVLYVGARYFPIAARLVAEMHEKVRLEATTPLFTKELWPGVSVAVEPGSGESFGSHRCRLTAEGIVDAWRAGDQKSAARFAAVSARFALAGLDLARPWLGPSGVDLFDIPEPARLA